MKTEDWIATWQRVSLDTYRALMPSLNTPGLICIYGATGQLLQIGYLSNLQKIQKLRCQFGPSLEIAQIFDGDFSIAYWSFPTGLDLEEIFRDLVRELSEDLPLKNAASKERTIKSMRSLPFSEEPEEELEEYETQDAIA